MDHSLFSFVLFIVVQNYVSAENVPAPNMRQLLLSVNKCWPPLEIFRKREGSIPRIDDAMSSSIWLACAEMSVENPNQLSAKNLPMRIPPLIPQVARAFDQISQVSS